MTLLALQSLSELVRRIEFLRGRSTRATLSEADLPPIAGTAEPREWPGWRPIWRR